MSGQKLLNWLMIALLLAGLGLVVWPVQASGGLPEIKSGDRDQHASAPLEATIELTAWPPGGMSVVQWQDSTGDWQAVDGWHGALDSSDSIRWWVAAKDFGTGPFRWAVSEPFNLPAGAGFTVRIDLIDAP